MKLEQDCAWSLEQLSEAVRLPARTLRFYIARGLLDGPDKAGRKARYGRHHAERIEWIRSMQKRGMTLSEIGCRVHGLSYPVQRIKSAAWRHYAVTDQVVVTVREDAAPWRVRQVQKAISGLRRVLEETSAGEETR